jgi:hypothetical protein
MLLGHGRHYSLVDIFDDVDRFRLLETLIRLTSQTSDDSIISSQTLLSPEEKEYGD